MKVDLSHPEKNVALISVDVDAERIAATRQAVHRRLAGKYNIPGFRRGKVPLAILERHVGKAFFDQEVLDQLLSEVYPEALNQAAVHPVSRPELDLVRWEPPTELSFTAKVTIKPEVALGQYTGFEVPKQPTEVPDDDVERELESLRGTYGRLIEVEGDSPLAAGSVAVIDFTGYVAGKAFEGGSAQDYPLEVGSGAFIPGFEDGLIGAKVGEERDVDVTFPAEYAGELAGKEATFKVTVKGHRRRELPELDDELARKAAPMLGLAGREDLTLVELREEIRRRLASNAERRAAADFEERVLAKVAGLAEIEVPDVMVANTVDARVADLTARLRRNEKTLAEYLADQDITEEALRERLSPAALESVRRELVVEAVGRQEGIVATEQEVDERVASYAQVRGEDPAKVRAGLGPEDIERIRDEITRRKTIEYLVGAQVAVAAPADGDDAETEGSDVEKENDDTSPASKES